jgi:hypothetical protein
MVICSCNVLTDHEIRDAAATVGGAAVECTPHLRLPWLQRAVRPLARTIQQILDEALTATQPDSPIVDLSCWSPVALAVVRNARQRSSEAL